MADARAAIPTQARPDAERLALWLHGRAAHTQRAYQRAVGRFVHFARKPLPAVTLGDLQAFAADLEGDGLAPAPRRLTLAAVWPSGAPSARAPKSPGAAVTSTAPSRSAAAPASRPRAAVRRWRSQDDGIPVHRGVRRLGGRRNRRRGSCRGVLHDAGQPPAPWQRLGLPLAARRRRPRGAEGVAAGVPCTPSLRPAILSLPLAR